MTAPASLIGRALELAARAHAGQVDKQHKPYIGHLLRVTAAVSDAGAPDWVVAAAALHDVLEDTDMTAEGLRAAGINPITIGLIVTLTHRIHEPNSDYLVRVVAGGPEAVLVKRCDVLDNYERLGGVDDPTMRLQRKYQRALNLLEEVQ